ncbi:MAG: sensor histidine kinase [Spirochaetia bacterium]
MNSLRIFFRRTFSDISIFAKLIISFLLLIFIPLIMTFVYSLSNLKDIHSEKLIQERQAVLEINADRTRQLMERMVSSVLYAETSDELSEKIRKNSMASEPENPVEIRMKNLQKWERINFFEQFFSDLTYTIIGYPCNITVITEDNRIFTNYSPVPGKVNQYMESIKYSLQSTQTYRAVWRGVEEDYSVNGIARSYVLTLIKPIRQKTTHKLRGAMVLSLPESSLRRYLSSQNDPPFLLVDSKSMNTVSLVEDGPVSISENYTSLETAVINDWLYLKTYMTPNAATNEFDIIWGRQLVVYAVCFIVFFFIAWKLSSNLAKPIQALTENIEKFPDEPLGLSYEQRDDEIGKLQRKFHEMHEKIYNLIETNREQEERKRRAELAALQAQISPHFLFNTLNSIRWAAVNNRNDKVVSMVVALGHLLKQTVSGSGEMITLEKEFEVLKSYVSILNMRHSMEFTAEFEIPSETKDYLVPKLIIQPLVENAILHGVAKKEGTDGVVKVHARIEGEFLVIEVSDNGPGFSDSFIEKTKTDPRNFSGIGLSNVKERLILNFGETSGLTYRSDPEKGTTVTINFHLSKRTA